jgi:hypothetical protein
MAWNKLPKSLRSPHAHLDEIDLEAEAQGASIRKFRAEHEIAKPQGRRLVKNESKESRGMAIAGVRQARNFQDDHQKALSLYLVK